MKKTNYLLLVVIAFCLLGVMRVKALTTFYYDKDLNQYLAADSSGIDDLNSEYIQGLILSRNTCLTPDTVVIPNGVGEKNACETFGGNWFPFGGNVNYGECKIVSKTVCESKGGAFYPTIVVGNGAINIDSDMIISYILIAYKNPININAKVTFTNGGNIGGTIGENGKIVISDTGKVEYPDFSKKLYGNTSEYDISVGTGSSFTYKSLAPNGKVFPADSLPADDVPEFLKIFPTTSDYMELSGNFKLNKPFTLINIPSSCGSRLVLKDNSTLDLLSDLTIDNGSKLTTGLNSNLLNSATLTVNGNLDIKGAFNNGYKLDNTNNPTTTNTGTTTVGTTGEITLYGAATGRNNSENDIPVTLDSEDSNKPPIESIIPSNRPKTITINSDITNGVVSTSKSSAVSGETITLTITPATRYRVKLIQILKSDNTDVTSSVNYNSTNKSFMMPNYNVKISAVFEEIDYSYFEESEEQTYKINKDNKLEFKLKPDYNLFENGGKVYVDDELVDQKYITSKSGSTIITISKEYLDKLSLGNHTLKVTFNTDVSVETVFTISREEPNPQTYDGILNFIIIVSISLIGLLGTSIYFKKRFN